MVGSTASTPRRVGRPRDGDSAKTRLTVVRAAMATFAEHGFDGATLDSIAKRSGVTTATLYHHFNSKEGIYIAVRAFVSARIVEEFRRVVDESTDFHTNLAGLIDASVGLTRAEPDMSRFAAAQPSERIRHPEMFVDQDPIAGFIVDMVQRGVANGVLDASVAPDRSAVIVGVILSGLGSAAAASVDRYETVARDVTAFLVEGRLPTSRTRRSPSRG